ncbi:TadE/TadG family type IV pilus assembly protein [Sphingomonas sp. LK11]|uniref:TadE/TadG family type IV pilus assembly protein n=1 Tax=Sphingomonas sp. LK11 TaxID=1390395 RepID=UPI001561A61D|nr:TadE/TadG family type IV pilus assembly protein [Sphingomonas sp. LK11]
MFCSIARSVPHRCRVVRPQVLRDRRGAALIEFALVLPILLTMLMGIVSFGEYFLTAHLVQQAANDAARAALAGMSATERKGIAVDTAKRMIDSTGILRSSRGQVDAVEVDNIMTVSIRYDATSDPLLNLPFVPTPGRTMTAKGIAMIGGL